MLSCHLSSFSRWITSHSSGSSADSKVISCKDIWVGEEYKIAELTNPSVSETASSAVESASSVGFLTNKVNNWELHKKHIKQKINKTLGILYRSRAVMSENSIIKMYKTFVEPYFLYALQVWGHSVTSDTDTINTLQNKVFRIVYNCKRSDDAWNENRGRILSVKELYQKTITRTCHKHHAKLLPKSFAKNNMPEIDYYNETRNRKTRSSIHNIFDYAKPKHPKMTDNFTDNCIRLWNKQTQEIKSRPYQQHWDRIVNDTHQN